MSHTNTIELPGKPPYQIYHIYCPAAELTEEQLQRLVDGIDLCFHIEDDPHDEGHRVDYELSLWQKRLFAQAKRTGILVNPTLWRYEHDALANVWEAYQGIHNRPVVIVRIAPTLHVTDALLDSGILSSPREIGMGAEYTIDFHPAFLTHLTSQGLEELRILIGLYTEDNPFNEDDWTQSMVNTVIGGDLRHVPGIEAMDVAQQVLDILREHSVDLAKRISH